MGQPDRALESHRQALALRQALLASDPGNQKFRRSIVISEINLGRALFLGGDFQGGLASNRKALATCEALVAESPSNADYRRLLANTYQNDGDYRAILRDVDGALRSFRTKLTFDEQALAEDPDNAVARMDAAYSHSRAGDLLAQGGSFGEALSSYRKAATQYGRLATEVSEDQSLRLWDILVRAGIGEMQARLGERAAALAESVRALALLDGIAPDPASGTRSSLRGQVYMRIAAAHAALGASGRLGAAERQQHWQTARDLFNQSLTVWQDMQRRGILTAEDRTKPEEITRELARCDAALRGLAG
jgi:tetratricopeptide (TPR) repeat protein